MTSMHKNAVQVENQENGNIRMREMEGSRIGDKTYTKYFLDKGGITVETNATQTQNMQINKRTITLSINKP